MSTGTFRTGGIAAVLVAFIATFFISQIAEALNTHSIDLERGTTHFLSITDGSQTGLDITDDLTIEAWIKVESAPGTNEAYTIASKYQDSGDQRSYSFAYEDSGSTKRLRFSAGNCGSSCIDTRAANVTLSNDTWYHVAVVYDASAGTADFFVDGSNIGQRSGMDSSIFDGSAPFIIGASSNGLPTVENVFDGLIDDVRVWNIARTGGEVADDRDDELNGNESGLVGYWKLNYSLSDATANGNTLTSNNSAGFSNDTHAPSFSEDLASHKTVNESLSGSTILQNDNDLVLSLAASKTYAIEGVIFASSTSATPDIIIGFLAQSGAIVTIGYTNEQNEAVLSSGATSTRIVLPANTPTSIHVGGTVMTSASGDFQLKWAQATSNAAATTVMKGSYLRAVEI